MHLANSSKNSKLKKFLLIHINNFIKIKDLKTIFTKKNYLCIKYKNQKLELKLFLKSGIFVSICELASINS